MNICIVKLSAMGDIVHTMVSLEFIRAKYPTANICWVVENSFKDILNQNQNIDKILPINLKSIKQKKRNIFSQISLLGSFAKHKFDIVIDAQGLLKSAIVSKIIAYSCRCEVVGFDRYSTREGLSAMFYSKRVKVAYKQNVITRNTKLFNTALDLSITKQNIDHKRPFWDIEPRPQGYVLFVVGASKPNKIYPKELFETVANGLSYDIMVIWANEFELSIATYLQQKCQNVTIAQKQSLDELKQTIIDSAMTIGGDTGPTHMAWGLNRPSLTIYGNTPALRNSYHTAINQTISSSSKVDADRLDKDDFSIENISPYEIIAKTDEILSLFKKN